VPVKGLVEKPSSKDAPSNLTVLGRYILPSAVLGLLETTVAGVGGEIQLTHWMNCLNLRRLNVFETDAGVFDCDNKRVF
jgi:UTP--glucose-1-phosphate uridylyltransferase